MELRLSGRGFPSAWARHAKGQFGVLFPVPSDALDGRWPVPFGLCRVGDAAQCSPFPHHCAARRTAGSSLASRDRDSKTPHIESGGRTFRRLQPRGRKIFCRLAAIPRSTFLGRALREREGRAATPPAPAVASGMTYLTIKRAVKAYVSGTERDQQTS